MHAFTPDATPAQRLMCWTTGVGTVFSRIPSFWALPNDTSLFVTVLNTIFEGLSIAVPFLSQGTLVCLWADFVDIPIFILCCQL